MCMHKAQRLLCVSVCVQSSSVDSFEVGAIVASPKKVHIHVTCTSMGCIKDIALLSVM